MFVGRCVGPVVLLALLSFRSMIVTDNGVVELMNTSDGSLVVTVVVRGVPEKEQKGGK